MLSYHKAKDQEHKLTRTKHRHRKLQQLYRLQHYYYYTVFTVTIDIILEMLQHVVLKASHTLCMERNMLLRDSPCSFNYQAVMKALSLITNI